MLGTLLRFVRNFEYDISAESDRKDTGRRSRQAEAVCWAKVKSSFSYIGLTTRLNAPNTRRGMPSLAACFSSALRETPEEGLLCAHARHCFNASLAKLCSNPKRRPSFPCLCRHAG